MPKVSTLGEVAFAINIPKVQENCKIPASKVIHSFRLIVRIYMNKYEV